MTKQLTIGDVIEADSSWCLRGRLGGIGGGYTFEVAQHFKDRKHVKIKGMKVFKSEGRMYAEAKWGGDISEIPPLLLKMKRPSPAPRGRQKITSLVKGSKRFVVTYAGVETDPHAPEGADDDMREGWYVEARQLNKDGSYNPKGQEITFSQSEFASWRDYVPKVKTVGKMDMIFVPRTRRKQPQP